MGVSSINRSMVKAVREVLVQKFGQLLYRTPLCWTSQSFSSDSKQQQRTDRSELWGKRGWTLANEPPSAPACLNKQLRVSSKTGCECRTSRDSNKISIVIVKIIIIICQSTLCCPAHQLKHLLNAPANKHQVQNCRMSKETNEGRPVIKK